jgi:hypothetical protein
VHAEEVESVGAHDRSTAIGGIGRADVFNLPLTDGANGARDRRRFRLHDHRGLPHARGARAVRNERIRHGAVQMQQRVSLRLVTLDFIDPNARLIRRLEIGRHHCEILGIGAREAGQCDIGRDPEAGTFLNTEAG